MAASPPNPTIQDSDGSMTLVDKRKDPPCQEEDNSQGHKTLRLLGPDLPEDIWRYIHSLLPLREAARVACISCAFLDSWRCHPNLIFDDELRWKANERGSDFIQKVNIIMKNHSGINVKKFKLAYILGGDVSVSLLDLNTWLKIAVTPGIEEVSFISPNRGHNFPSSLLSVGIRNSIRHLKLGCCTFHPTVDLGSFSRLVKLQFCGVQITGDELGYLLCKSFALEQLEIECCHEIICLEIPSLLQRLSYLVVLNCDGLKTIKSTAPNISTLECSIDDQLELSLAESSKIKEIDLCGDNTIFYACSKFPSLVPNLGSLAIRSYCEMVNTPMLHTKFLHLKYLSISTYYMHPDDGNYDYFSLISLLGASPSLETFTLKSELPMQSLAHLSILQDSSNLRHVTEPRHYKLRNMKITGFSSLKSLVELTCHIVENAISLECLTLDTTNGYSRRSATNSGKTCSTRTKILMEAPKALSAIRKYIEGKVPTTVRFSIVEP